MINDSGGTAEIHLSDIEGNSRGFMKIKGAKNIDWEDLASFTYRGASYLLIADTGDNASKRQSVRLIVVREPPLPEDGLSIRGELEIAWQFDFVYEDGPKDCEAVAVDIDSERVILVSKRTETPQVYELPLRPQGADGQIAKRIGKTKVIAPARSLIPFRNQPTGLDISKDGKTAAIVTYYGVFLFSREAGETWEHALEREPIPLGNHRLLQAESIAFSNDAKTIYCISEGVNSPIRRFVLHK